MEIFEPDAFMYAHQNAAEIEKLKANPVLDLVEKMNKQMGVLEYRIKRLEEIVNI